MLNTVTPCHKQRSPAGPAPARRCCSLEAHPQDSSHSLPQAWREDSPTKLARQKSQHTLANSVTLCTERHAKNLYPRWPNLGLVPRITTSFEWGKVVEEAWKRRLIKLSWDCLLKSFLFTSLNRLRLRAKLISIDFASITQLDQHFRAVTPAAMWTCRRETCWIENTPKSGS